MENTPRKKAYDLPRERDFKRRFSQVKHITVFFFWILGGG